MAQSGVSASIWCQNVLIGLLGCAVSCFCIAKGVRIKPHAGYGFLFPVLLFLPLLFEGAEGVFRWISLFGIRFHVASLVLPMAVVWLFYNLQKGKFSIVVMLLIAYMLLLQPDSGQMTGFVASSLYLLFSQIPKAKKWTLLVALCLLGMGVFVWVLPDGLCAVPYVEGILPLLYDTGIGFFLLGLIALLSLPLPFLFYKKGKHFHLHDAFFPLFLYYVAMLIVPFFGHFPILLMGHGLSPIIGYLFALTLALAHASSKEDSP